MDRFNATHSVACCIVSRGDEVLLLHRKSEPFVGCLEVPGGWIEAGETPEIAALREFEEETGAEAVIRSQLASFEMTVPSYGSVRFFFFYGELVGKPRSGTWMTLAQALSEGVSPADEFVLGSLATAHQRRHWNGIWDADRFARASLRRRRAAQKVTALEALHLNDRHRVTVVDVGCGSLEVLGELHRRGVGERLVGIDFSISALRGTAPEASRLLADANALPLRDGCADTVLAIGLIEHVALPNAVLSEARRVLMSTGELFITTSSKWTLVYLVRRLRERIGWWPYGFQRNMSHEEVRMMVAGAGFDDVEIRPLHAAFDFPVSAVLDRVVAWVRRDWARYYVIRARRRTP